MLRVRLKKGRGEDVAIAVCDCESSVSACPRPSYRTMRRHTVTVLHREDPVVRSIERRVVREVSG